MANTDDNPIELDADELVTASRELIAQAYPNASTKDALLGMIELEL